MNGLLQALRSIQERTAQLRKNTIGDFHQLTGLFAAGKRLALDDATRSVAEAGRYMAEDLNNAFELEVIALLKLIDEAIALVEARND
ncbi:hypothetical protein J2801_002141 [Paraburkholderia phenoliruptrix]|uniref:hypothetical protein n=1 Tax=Paraburkholderia phenoliruptrix TaxID=252970 RepID=UPI0028593077|nr:hypothetical protein [Paraburkholderia phenoliruptrix]MDR6419890.1 hypothetical protein [Paraburkholderia phenoliruptrix]